MQKGFTRRQFVLGTTAIAATVVGARLTAPRPASAAGSIELPPLPYPENGLDPYISSNTLSFHYGKHHRAYVDTTNKLIEGTNLAGQPLEKIVAAAANSPEKVPLFNAAAQAWNHGFYWKSMRPKGGGAPTGPLAPKIDAAFGGYDAFKKAFAEAALGQFGSGWAWLVTSGDQLKILKTANADTPIIHGVTPLLTIDVWEHAYYLDYQNRRADYVSAWLDHLVNWEFAAENLAKT